jgi:catechol 2,3-dioxygenase-like lactoylglutathione lyase family enzyme
MPAKAVSWLGTMTEHLGSMRSFYRDLFGVEPTVDSDDFVVFHLPSGDTVELFSPAEPDHRHFTTGPVAGFLVEDLAAATEILRAAGIELLGTPGLDETSGVGWAHFRAPDGNVYELTQNPWHPVHQAAARRPELAPLAGEDHVCTSCGIAYASISPADAAGSIACQPAAVRQAASVVPEPLLRRRPDPDTWSVLEYVCHLRDVYATTTLRLYRTRTEDHPAVEPMLNDLRAARFGYNRRDLAAVPDELADVAEGLGQEIARVSGDGWERRCSRLPGEYRGSRWLVRQAMHEGIHHLRDIEEVARRVTAPPSEE